MNTNTDGITFVVIPMDVFQNGELTATEKMLYGYLSIFKKQCCFQSNEDIAEKLGASVPTITRGLKKLQKLGYVFIEFVNGSNSKRRIYAVFDNPKKLKYLIRKGLLNGEEQQSFPQTFPQSNQNDEKGTVSNQNDEKSNQNDDTTDPCSSNHFDEHKIIEYKKYSSEPENSTPGGLAGSSQPPRRRPKPEDFESREEWERAFYAWNTLPA